MDMSVAFATDQRNVADCPRSMVRGSAAKSLIRGAADGGGGASALGGGGGGGGGTGAFFLQPAADKSKTVTNTAALSVLVLIRIFFLLGLLGWY
jgi:hypothetical protein